MYDYGRAKIASNIQWLFTKANSAEHIAEDGREPFYAAKNEQDKIKQEVIGLLLSCELYSRVCSLILNTEPAAFPKSPQAVLQALSRKRIYVVDNDNKPVTDRDLECVPFKLSAHMALIDALMTADTVERIIQNLPFDMDSCPFDPPTVPKQTDCTHAVATTARPGDASGTAGGGGIHMTSFAELKAQQCSERSKSTKPERWYCRSPSSHLGGYSKLYRSSREESASEPDQQQMQLQEKRGQQREKRGFLLVSQWHRQRAAAVLRIAKKDGGKNDTNQLKADEDELDGEDEAVGTASPGALEEDEKGKGSSCYSEDELDLNESSRSKPSEKLSRTLPSAQRRSETSPQLASLAKGNRQDLGHIRSTNVRLHKANLPLPAQVYRAAVADSSEDTGGKKRSAMSFSCHLQDVQKAADGLKTEAFLQKKTAEKCGLLKEPDLRQDQARQEAQEDPLHIEEEGEEERRIHLQRRQQELPQSVSSGSPRHSSQTPEQQLDSFSSSSSPSSSATYSGLRLYKDFRIRSNKQIIHNALYDCCLAGKVNEPQRNQILQDLESCEFNHLMILFRNGGTQFRGLYTYQPDTDEIKKLTGAGPRSISKKMIEKLYKYSSEHKLFNVQRTKTVSLNVDALSIHNNLWRPRK